MYFVAWCPLGALLGSLLWASVGVLEAFWAVLRASWRPLGPSWARLGAPWAVLERPGAVLEPSWRRLGASWARLGPFQAPQEGARSSYAALLWAWGTLSFKDEQREQEQEENLFRPLQTRFMPERRHAAGRLRAWCGSNAQQSCVPATALGAFCGVQSVD